MIRLATQAELGWVTLIPDEDESKSVRVRVLPVTRAMRRRAKRAALKHIEGADLDALEQTDLEDFGDALSTELLRLAIADWAGVLGDDDQPAELTPAAEVRMRTSAKPDRPRGTIDDFLAMDEIFQIADKLIVLPIVTREREKNGSPASPNGTGEAGTRAKTIAGSPAKPRRKAGAKSARTGSKSSRQPRAKKSGAS